MTHELKKINEEIASLTRALSQTPDDHPNMSLLLAHLGKVHACRYELLRELDDLEKAIEYKTITLTLTPNHDPGLSELLFTLAAVHGHRFLRLGDLNDIEKAIEYGHISVDLANDDDSALAFRLANLGTQHTIRFQHLGELTDLEDAIQYESLAVALTPDGDPDLPGMLNSLGMSHTVRFQRLGERNDIEKAIEYGTRALALAPDDHPHSDIIIHNLGTAHSDRFQRLGELPDLDKAIQYQSRALALTPEGHPDLPSRLSTLGVSHSDRFERLGELSDLENAIEFQSRALALTPDGHPDLPDLLANLAVSHKDRCKQLGVPADLENAIEYEFRALALTPNGHPNLPSRLVNLGVSYNDRFKRLGELNDLENAIEYQSRALALTPDGHPSSSIILANLAVFHTNRFEQLGQLGDLKHALDYESRALALTPDGHPDTLKWQSNHANTYLHYYRLTRDPSHLQHSLDLFRSASQSLSGAPREKFKVAQDWVKTASMHNPDSCMEAYQTVVDLLPQFIWLGATINQRYQDLSMTRNLAVDAASAAIHFSNYSLALEWLEHARCVVWNQSLMLRSPLDKLQSVHPELGTRLETVANQLHKAGSDSRESRALASGSMSPEQFAQEHRRLAKEYDDLLVRVRDLPGFDDFLRPMKAKGLTQAARTGPVVVINCYEDNCDALLILPGEENIGHVSLPNFSAQKAQQARQTLDSSLRCKGIRERGVKVRQEPGHEYGMSSVLATLWHNVVKPILDYLGCMSNDSSISLPHITWCPTGPLSFLPLHAAGDYTQPPSRVFDYAISSYTPTLTALLASSPDSLSDNCRVLAVGQSNTPGHSRLPGTARELAYVQDHTSDNSHYSQLIDNQATVAAVLDAMGQHNWVHLACHAHQNVNDPTKSGFFLHNGTLDLATINRRSFKGKGLAYLSACQTATGDERLADEAVHLASGMLMAGFSSVIATMWSVHDEDAPVVADKVYAQLMKDRRLGNGEAGRALHDAVAALRETVGEQKFERWVPYIHIGS